MYLGRSCTADVIPNPAGEYVADSHGRNTTAVLKHGGDQMRHAGMTGMDIVSVYGTPELILGVDDVSVESYKK
jgi:hypothetical protein